MDASEYRSSREELGLSQTALAKRLGVSRETISNRERDTGRSRINGEAALAIKALVSLSNWVEAQIAIVEADPQD